MGWQAVDHPYGLRVIDTEEKRLVCVPEYAPDAHLIARAPQMYKSMQQMRNLILTYLANEEDDRTRTRLLTLADYCQQALEGLEVEV